MFGVCGIDGLQCTAYEATLTGDEGGPAQMAETSGKGALGPRAL